MIQNTRYIYIISNIFSIFLVFLYIVLSFYYANNINHIGDTLVYKDIYYSSTDTYAYYGIEFLVPTIMFIFREINIPFEGYLFFSLLLWLPLFYSCSKNITKNKIYPLAFCFFLLTPYFYLNSLFLIRQYYAACFFLIGLYFSDKNKKTLYLFYFLSIISHSSALLWVLFSTNLFTRIITKKTTIIILISIIIYSFLLTNFLSNSIELIIHLGSSLNNENISRKIIFYSSGEYLLANQLALHFLLYSIGCFISSFICLKLKTMTRIETKICSLILIQSFFMILFRENIVLANRIGFFVYYFSVPCLSFLLITLIRPMKK